MVNKDRLQVILFVLQINILSPENRKENAQSSIFFLPALFSKTNTQWFWVLIFIVCYKKMSDAVYKEGHITVITILKTKHGRLSALSMH